MKKLFVFISCIIITFILSGCSMDNTPTKRVENFLDNYTNNSQSVLKDLKEMVDSDSLMNDDQRTTYSDIMKRQYKDMTYEIKDETIDGDNATVTAEIEVYDYYKINRDSQEYFNNNRNEFKEDTNDKDDKNEGLVEKAAEGVKEAAQDVKDAVDGISSSKYIDYRLKNLQNANDRVKYTIDFTLRKVNDKWVLNELDDATRQKIHGLYEH